jgi:TatD DNase family protein
VFTDTHCHLNLDGFDADRELVLDRAIQAGVGRILIPGIGMTTSLSAVKLAENHPLLFAAIGVHPTEVGTFHADTLESLYTLALKTSGSLETSKIVAIGEIGLDYYWDSTPHDHQQNVLKEQLALAAKLQLPVVIHFREKGDASGGKCASDLMKILEEWGTGLKGENSTLVERPGVLHSFSGSLEMAQAALGLGFYLGVAGPVTFENGWRWQALAAALPLDRILIETDAPFRTPHPHRGKRNEPAYVRLIADKIASVQSTTIDLVAVATSDNARRLFAWE